MRSAPWLVVAAVAGCSPAPPAPLPVPPPRAVPAPKVDRCADPSPRELGGCVDAARIERDVRAIAKPRPPGSAHWQRVQDLCAARFEEAGFRVERHRYETGVNVIGRRGKDGASVVIGAHYDHIEGCSGADDNATGVAVVLETARLLGKVQLDRPAVMACWDEEERGLLGSTAHAQRARDAGENIAAAIVLDGVGARDTQPGSQRLPSGAARLFGRQLRALKKRGMPGDFIAMIGDTSTRSTTDALEKAASVERLPVVRLDLRFFHKVLLTDMNRSDHAAFWLAGYPAVLLSDTADFRNPRYHCGAGDDDADHVDHAFVAAVARVTVRAATAVLQGL